MVGFEIFFPVTVLCGIMCGGVAPRVNHLSFMIFFMIRVVHDHLLSIPFSYM